MSEFATGGVAILGWGSLIWELDDLAEKVRGGWSLGAGPVLPVEFCRISPKRLDALALAIDPIHGAPCRTAVIMSARDSVAEAAADLAARERAPLARIGFVDLRNGDRRATHAALAQRVADWAAARRLTGAVWTDLPPNFQERGGRPFSVTAALEHFRALEGAARAEGVRYVHRAPAETDTPVRRALAAEDWWAAAVAVWG